MKPLWIVLFGAATACATPVPQGPAGAGASPGTGGSRPAAAAPAAGEPVDWYNQVPWAKQRPPIPDNDWDRQRTPSFQIFDNVYYVGLRSASAYVITTAAGLVLLDTTYAETGDHVIAGIAALGLDPAAVAYIVISHGHLDHAGGIAAVKRAAPAAKVAMAEGDWRMLEEYRRADPSLYRRMPGDLQPRDGETLSLGDATFTFWITPGHTPGCLTAEYRARHGKDSYRVLGLGGVGFNFDAPWTATYVASLERMRARRPDLLLLNHPYMPAVDLFDSLPAIRDRRPDAPHPLADARATDLWFEALLAVARRRLEAERAAPP